MRALTIQGVSRAAAALIPQTWHREDPHVAGAALAGVGALFAGLGLSVILLTVRRRLRWVRATGRIVGVEASRVGDLPRVEFVDDQGIRRHFTSRFAYNDEAGLRAGTTVDVVVNPKDPTEGMIASGRLAGLRVALFVGGLFLVIGLLVAGIGVLLLNLAPEPRGW